MHSSFKTHIGLVRQINQDYGLITKLDDATTLIIVADGMGGHKAGEVASKMATELVHSSVLEHWNTKSWESLLQSAIQTANEQIYTLASQEPDFSGMGTTIEVAIFNSEEGIIAHVGDSRVYMWQEATLHQLTEDHSLVYALYKSGQITHEEIETHPQKNVILRAIGTEQHIDVDLIDFSWSLGDRILLCSDGLFKHVNNERISEYLQKQETVDIIADQLIQHAVELGGEDNITIAIVENTMPHMGGEDR